MTVKELEMFKMAQNHRQSRETKIITLNQPEFVFFYFYLGTEVAL